MNCIIAINYFLYKIFNLFKRKYIVGNFWIPSIEQTNRELLILFRICAIAYFALPDDLINMCLLLAAGLVASMVEGMFFFSVSFGL